MIEGTYQLERNEKFAEYLVAIDPELPLEIAEEFAQIEAVFTASVEKDKYTFVVDYGLAPQVLSFTLGQTFEDEVLSIMRVRSIAQKDGDKIVIKSSTEDGRSGERTYEFSKEGLTTTCTSQLTNVVAKLFYKRI